MADPVVRALHVLEILQSAHMCSVADLARRLGVDERTVRRDVARLVAAGVHIESLRGRYGGYRLAPGGRALPITFTSEEAVAVFLRLAHAQSTAGDHDISVQTALSKIRRAVRPQDVERGEAALGLISRATAEGAAEPAPGVILTLAQAIESRRVVELRYRNVDGVPSRRRVHPIDVVARSARWYLVAFDADRGEDRVFRIDRIRTVRALPETFPAPDLGDTTFSLDEHFASAAYRWTVVLQINATEHDIRRYLPATIAHLRQVESAPSADAPWYRAEIHAADLDWIPAVIGALDCAVHVESPPELRDLVRMTAKRMLQAASGRAWCDEPGDAGRR